MLERSDEGGDDGRDGGEECGEEMDELLEDELEEEEEEGADPRMADRVQKWKEPVVDLDQLAPDYMSLLSLMLGLLAYLLEVRVLAWVSLFCFASSIANQNYTLVDIKQVGCTVICVCLGLFANYSAQVFC